MYGNLSYNLTCAQVGNVGPADVDCQSPLLYQHEGTAAEWGRAAAAAAGQRGRPAVSCSEHASWGGAAVMVIGLLEAMLLIVTVAVLRCARVRQGG